MSLEPKHPLWDQCHDKLIRVTYEAGGGANVAIGWFRREIGRFWELTFDGEVAGEQTVASIWVDSDRIVEVQALNKPELMAKIATAMKAQQEAIDRQTSKITPIGLGVGGNA
jgi:hypothetical protein